MAGKAKVTDFLENLSCVFIIKSLYLLQNHDQIGLNSHYVKTNILYLGFSTYSNHCALFLVIQEKVEEEEEEDDYTASSDDNHSISDGNDVEEEISFKEPSLVINSPPNNQSPSRLTSPVGQQQHQQKVQPLRSSPEPRITTTLPSTRGMEIIAVINK